ncbi:hypothetical protein [Actinotalea sp. K2]|uniref:hypothetical protein n=1 Tax=Actinotalea sp. K2 TaxID=2939438 RepID=UPI00201793DD|nr:hypothetical protein [Actinotalea sp. K2]MCL3863113.1 hypothetical protein [Actinotalea sp. K2]
MNDDDAARTDHVFGAIEASLAQAGWTEAQLPATEGPMVAMRTSEFRWRWVASRLHTIAVVLPLHAGETRAGLDALLGSAVTEVKRSLDGVPLGFQAGIAVILTLVGRDLDPEVRQWAAHPRLGGYAVVVHPVVVDLADGQVLEPRRRWLGIIFHSYLRGLVRAHVTPFVTPDAAVPTITEA